MLFNTVINIHTRTSMVDFWILGFLDFKIFGFLGFLCSTLVFSICRNSSNIGFGKKTAFVTVFTVFLRGVRVVGGGDHIYIYIYVYPRGSI